MKKEDYFLFGTALESVQPNSGDDVRVCNDEPCEVHAGHYVIRPYGRYCIVALPETEKNTTLSTTAFGESVHFKNDGRKRHRTIPLDSNR